MLAVSRRARLTSSILVAAGIAAASLAVRAPALDRAFTIDEKLWLERSERFVSAVADARFADTVESGHPGVTTMWVGGLAQRTLPDEAGLRERYERARLGVAVVSTSLIIVVWWLAGVLLAFDPFLLTLGRVLHVDSFLSLLMVASFLALLGAVRTGERRMLILSGALAGLAALTKQPAVLLVPTVVVVLWRDEGGVWRRFGIWLGAAAVVAFGLWPALWVRPWHAIAVMAGGGGKAVAETSSAGFFLGRATGNPGPLFYPVVLALRTSIVSLPGIVVAAVWAVRRRKTSDQARLGFTLLAFALLFVLFLIVAPKKADRYVLPSIVAADVALAVAAANALERSRRFSKPAVFAATGVVAMALHGGPAMALSPYQNASYNWLAGGPVAAQRAIVIGWGEGLDEAAGHLNELQGSQRATVAVSRVTQFDDFFIGRTIRIENSSLARANGQRPDFVLFYISSVQSGKYDEIWRTYRNREPIYELRINRIPYVRVYRVDLG